MSETTHVRTIQRAPETQPAQSPPDTLDDLVLTVREVAAQRMLRNSYTLEIWRGFLRDRLTPAQVMGQVLAQEGSDLFATAAKGGAATQQLAKQWTQTSNPGYRFLQEQQIHGAMRACTGCHVANLAWQLQNTGGREWTTPTEQLGFFAPSSTGTKGSSDPLNPDPTPFLRSVAGIRPYLEQLGPRGYRVLPEEVMNRSLTPEQLKASIDQNIRNRQKAYAEYIVHIRNRDVEWFDLKQVVDELLPFAAPQVRKQAEEAIASAKLRRGVGAALETIAQIALLLLVLFPPTSLIAIGVGATAGGFLIGSGAAKLEHGLTQELALGAHDVLTPQQQAQASADVMGGAANIFSGVMAVGGAIFGAAARPAAAGGSSLAAGEGALVAGTTAQRGGWTFTAAADGSGVIGTSAKYPGVIAFMDQNGVTLFSVTGGRMQPFAFRAWPNMSSAGGAQGAAGAGTTAIVPTGPGPGPSASQAWTPPVFQVYVPPAQLGVGAATDRTLNQVLNLRGPARWSEAERYYEQLYGGTGQVHRPVALDPLGAYPVTTPGGRFTDVTAPGGAGQTLGIEVKTYGRWRTVNGVAQEQRVPLSEPIREQIHKDLALRKADPKFDPRWIFSDAPPSAELQAYLREVGIMAIWR